MSFIAASACPSAARISDLQKNWHENLSQCRRSYAITKYSELCQAVLHSHWAGLAVYHAISSQSNGNTSFWSAGQTNITDTATQPRTTNGFRGLWSEIKLKELVAILSHDLQKEMASDSRLRESHVHDCEVKCIIFRIFFLKCLKIHCSTHYGPGYKHKHEHIVTHSWLIWRNTPSDATALGLSGRPAGTHFKYLQYNIYIFQWFSMYLIIPNREGALNIWTRIWHDSNGLFARQQSRPEGSTGPLDLWRPCKLKIHGRHFVGREPISQNGPNDHGQPEANSGQNCAMGSALDMTFGLLSIDWKLIFICRPAYYITALGFTFILVVFEGPFPLRFWLRFLWDGRWPITRQVPIATGQSPKRTSCAWRLLKVLGLAHCWQIPPPFLVIVFFLFLPAVVAILGFLGLALQIRRMAPITRWILITFILFLVFIAPKPFTRAYKVCVGIWHLVSNVIHQHPQEKMRCIGRRHQDLLGDVTHNHCSDGGTSRSKRHTQHSCNAHESARSTEGALNDEHHHKDEGKSDLRTHEHWHVWGSGHKIIRLFLVWKCSFLTRL